MIIKNKRKYQFADQPAVRDRRGCIHS